MASPRITNTMREGIINNTITAQFQKEVDAIKEREDKLAHKAKLVAFSKAELEAFKTIAHMLSPVACISTNVGGKKIMLRYAEPQQLLRKYVSNYGDAVVLTSKLAEDVEKLADDKEDLNNRINKAKTQLEAMLSSVQTFKKLRLVWPQGEKFYDMYDVDSEVKSGVPAIVITELNKILGIK